MPKKSKIIVIVGPTASGKSALAVRLGKKLKGEVVSADSMQVYRGLNIGTCKITKSEMKGVPHHLLDVASPRTQFSVARYTSLAHRAIKDITHRGRTPILCGGTGHYIDAVLGIQSIPEVAPNPKLRTTLEKESAESLFARLMRLDPVRANNIDKHNKRRLIRALEIIDALGGPVPAPKKETLLYDAVFIGLNPEKTELKKRIEKRLKKDTKRGLIKEVQTLHKKMLSWKRLEELGLEYRVIAQFLQGKIEKKELLPKLETELWHYAKRQMTWFKRNPHIHWVKNEKEALAVIKNTKN